MTNRYIPLAAILCAAITLNACGGGGSNGGLVPSQPGSPTSVPSSAPSSTPTASFVINVPSAASSSSVNRRPQFDSPNTRSVRIALQSVNGQPNTSFSQTAAVNATAPGCAATSSGFSCTIKVGGVTGTDMYSLSTYQSNDASGPVLATATVGVTVSATSSSPTQVSLGGVPASVAFSPAKLPLVNDGNIHRVPVTLNVADASGATIVGATAYQSSVSLQIQNDPAHALTLSTVNVSQPGTVVTVTYDSSKPLQDAQIFASDNGMQGATLQAAPLSLNQTSVTLFDDGSNPTGIQVTEAGFTGTFSATLADANIVNESLLNGTAGSGNAVVKLSASSGVRFNTTTLTVSDGNVSTSIPVVVAPHNQRYTAYGSAHTLVTPLGLAKGPDGRLWTSDAANGNMVAFNTSTQAYQTYNVDPNNLGLGPSQFAFDASGNIWFADFTEIGEFNPTTNTTAIFSTGLSATPHVTDVIAGPPGSNTMYFFDIGGNFPLGSAQPTYIGSINTTNGQITEYQTPNNERPDQSLRTPMSMVVGPDNAVWFSDSAHFNVTRFDTSTHTFKDFSASTPTWPSMAPLQLVDGPDGNIWFTATQPLSVNSVIGRIDVANGDVQTFNEGISGGFFWSLVPGTDGNIWFTEQEGQGGVLAGISLFTTFGVIKPTIRTENGAPSVAYYQYPETITPEDAIISNMFDGGGGTMWTVDTNNGQFGEVTFK
jgi:streptogramin lyase